MGSGRLLGGSWTALGRLLSGSWLSSTSGPPPGRFLGCLGDVLGRLGCVLGRHMPVLGGVLGRPGAVLEGLQESPRASYGV